MEASDVWVAKDDDSVIVRAAAIVSVGSDQNGNIVVRLGHGEGAAVILADPGSRARPADDFHRQLISTVAQLSDASGAFLVRPVFRESRGWQWVTEPL